MIAIRNLSLQMGDKILFSNADLRIDPFQKVALVGRNGCGKSTLFGLLLGQRALDQGELELPKNARINHLEQETPALRCSALDHVLAAHAPYWKIESARREAESEGRYEEVAEYYHQIHEINGFELPARAAQLLAGLGFDDAAQQRNVAEFSGGWRMRINLARTLMTEADIFLLDEPTNHLELEVILWLEEHLKKLNASVVFISHDRAFIDAVATGIAHIDQQKIEYYRGNYSDFERLRAERRAHQASLYEKQQKQRAHLQSFIDRFKAKASKAKQAQSRVKQLEKMELIVANRSDSAFSFDIPQPTGCTNPIIQLNQASLGYGEHLILKDIQYSVETHARIGLLGMNGAGKSTLLKALVGELPCVAGERVANKQAKIAYFAQQQIDTLPLKENLMHFARSFMPGKTEQQIRTYLGRYLFSGDQVHKPIGVFSGGEKSRIALAQLLYEPSHLIILDEPTNHLDMETREALLMALQEYAGSIVLVSHDRFLLESLVDEFYLVHDQRVTAFSGDLRDYQDWYWNAVSQSEKNKTENTSPKTTQKSNERNEAEIKKLEKEMKRLQDKIAALTQNLERSSVQGDAFSVEQVVQWEQELKTLRQQLATCEEQWLSYL